MITVTKKPPILSLVMNPAILELSTDISGFVNPRLLVDVAFPGIAFSGGSDILYPRTNEVVYCNINEYLASAYADIESLSKTFTFPDYLKDWTEVEGFCKKYEIHIRERSDDGPNDVDLNITNRYVLPGVIPSWKKDLFYSQYASFWDWLNTKKPHSLHLLLNHYQLLRYKLKNYIGYAITFLKQVIQLILKSSFILKMVAPANFGNRPLREFSSSFLYISFMWVILPLELRIKYRLTLPAK